MTGIRLKIAECLTRGRNLVESTSEVVAYFDGACKPNPGQMGLGIYYLPKYKNHNSLDGIRVPIPAGPGTNNLAEWKALEALLLHLVQRDTESALIRGDSKLVIEQINGRWKVKTESHQAVAERCYDLLCELQAAKIEWIPRHLNAVADSMANISLMGE
jgi:ribonuclease HI